MTVLNLARRRTEIGLLAALGLSARRIRSVFLARVGYAALLGILIGVAPSLVRHGLAGTGQPTVWLLAAIAAALPATLTAAIVTHRQLARRDPAEVLKNES